MVKLPALPPSPLLLGKTVPEKYRPLAFAPLLVLVGFLVFAIVGLVLQEFEIALVAGVVAGPVGAYAAVGPPFTRAQLARARAKLPATPPDKRPFLFFPAFLIAAALLYFVLGFVATSTPLDEDVVALLALGVAIPAGVAVGLVLYGFPRLKGGLRNLRSPLEKVPPDKRPFLFFPLGLLLAAPLYFLLGYAFTEVLEPDIAVLLGLVLGLAGGFAGAYRLVGVPRATLLREKVQQLPEVPARARPAAFLATVVLAGTAFAVALGGTVGSLDALSAGAAIDLAFPLFLLAGWLLAAPLAGRLFGYPVPDRPLREYVPRITADQRPAVLLPLTLALGLALMFVLGMVLGLVPLGDLEDAALSAAIAFPAALLVAMRALGIRLREVDPRGLEEVPERARPLVVVALALFAGTVLFALVGQVEGGFLPAVALSYGAGLALALLLVDRTFLLDLGRRRRAQKAKEQAIEARLRAEMGLPAEAPRAQASGAGKLLRRARGKA